VQVMNLVVQGSNQQPPVRVLSPQLLPDVRPYYQRLHMATQDAPHLNALSSESSLPCAHAVKYSLHIPCHRVNATVNQPLLFLQP